MIHCPDVAWKQDVVPATQCVTADSTGKTWPQPVAATGCPGGWQYAKISRHGSLREKEWQHPVLEVYYFHISRYVCEPLGPLYNFIGYGTVLDHFKLFLTLLMIAQALAVHTIYGKNCNTICLSELECVFSAFLHHFVLTK